MPRIPFLKGFSEYVRIGKTLADVHLHYEQPVNPSEIGLTIEINKEDYIVKQMKFSKNGKNVLKDTIIFNENIKISGIPEGLRLYHQWQVRCRVDYGTLCNHNQQGKRNNGQSK